MLKSIVAFALVQRVFVVLATAALAAGGLFAWRSLAIEAFPDVQDVQVQVVTQVPGAAPEEVERSVTIPIEREMNGVPRQTQVRSVSIFGLSVVTVTFADRTNDWFARQQVLEKLANAALPPSVQPTLGPLTNAVGEVWRYVLTAPAGMPPREVRAVQDWQVRPALRRVAGVADVVSFGGTVTEMQVRADPQKLRAYGVTVDQLRAALVAGSSNTGGGVIRRGDEALVVRALGLARTPDDFARLPLAASDGSPITVGDVAQVVVGDRSRSGIVAAGTQDSVVEGIVQMTKGSNAAAVVADVRAAVESLGLPAGVVLTPIYDRTTLVDHTVHTVVENLGTGALLVVAILIVFLRDWRAAAIVASIIPLALLTAFLCMHVAGVSANLISLGSVDFGIIVDSAVVLVEALMVRMAVARVDAGGGPVPLATRMGVLRGTVQSLGGPILFSKAIIILAFLPIFTFQRVEGKIFSPMAWTLSFALAGAIVLTLTWVPALLSWALRRREMAERHSAWMERLRDAYRRLLARVFDRPRAVAGVAVGLLVASLVAAPGLGTEFLPKLDEGNLWLTITLPPAIALDRAKEVERAVRGMLASTPEVTRVVSHVGRPDDGTDPKGANNVEILADLAPRASWRFADKEALVADLTRRLHAMPGVPTNFSQVIEDNVEEALSGVKGEVAIKIFGPDLDLLEDLAARTADVVAGVRGAADVAAIKVGGAAEVSAVLDRDRMARLGLRPDDVNATVVAMLGGATVGTWYDGERRFDVTLRLDAPYRSAVDDVAEVPVSAPGMAAPVRLGDVARIVVREGPARIGREAGGRMVAVKANLRGRDQGSFVAEARARVSDKVHLPPGYRMSWGGQFENQQRATARLEVIVPLSLAGIFVLLFWAFRSVPKALLVLGMVPFTLIGGLAGLALAGLHLSISAAVGFIAVAGISVQNGVIMVERFHEALDNGAALRDAVLDGAVERLRPILMTALMAGLGLLPAALSHGIGSETQRPFAVVIVGGIVSATTFTLLLLPLGFERVSRGRAPRRTEAAAGRVPSSSRA
ncbi:MAG: CusA/CzcA family heavy metal efflux RND transporter [Burkholderiales bacterium]|nr:CusA/CzcA family heavy metal efflux RND transporter [Burkholderiales bacterium]